MNHPLDTSHENPILGAAASVVAETLAELGHALAAPIKASFRTPSCGSSGVELTVRLKDPSRAEATRAAIAERFGGQSAVDVVRVL